MQHRAALQAEIERVFATLASAQILERLEAADIASARLNSMQEFWDHPQLKARARWVKVGSPAGEIDALKPPLNLEGFEPNMGAIPAVGQHTRALLDELGYSAGEIERLEREKAI